MKKYFLFIVIFTPLLMTNCKSDDPSELDCSLVDCIVNSIIFEIISKDTQENLFTNGTYKAEDIHLTRKGNGQNIPFSFVDYDDLNIVSAFTVNDINNNENYIFSISNQLEFEVEYSVTAPTELTCCPNYIVNNFKITGLDYEFDYLNQTCTIFVEEIRLLD